MTLQLANCFFGAELLFYPRRYYGEHSPVVGIGNWTIAKRAGRIEGDVAGPLASLLNQLARMSEWKAQPLRSWVTRRGQRWREDAEALLLTADEAWDSGDGAHISACEERTQTKQQGARALRDFPYVLATGPN